MIKLQDRMKELLEDQSVEQEYVDSVTNTGQVLKDAKLLSNSIFGDKATPSDVIKIAQLIVSKYSELCGEDFFNQQEKLENNQKQIKLKLVNHRSVTQMH